MEARISQPRGGKPIRSPKVAQRRSRMRAELVSAGAALFARGGIGAVSVEDIIEAAGVSRATFYGIFANKQELLAAILEPVFNEGAAALDALAGAHAEEIVPGIAQVYEALWATRRDAMCLIAGIDQSVFPYLREGHDRFTSSLRRQLEEVQAAGLLRNSSAELSFRVVARTAVPVSRGHRPVPFARPFWKLLTEG